MNKPAVVLLGFVVAVGAVSAGGAWYTGKQLEPVLQTAVQDANKELQRSMAGVDGRLDLELVSLDRGLFSSTAHYRLKAQGSFFGEQNPNPELLFVDHIEHGPLPFSRLVSLKWLPVMATSHYSLEKNPTTEKWFAAAKDVSPLKGVANIGYNRSVSGNFELLPLEFKDDKSSASFSGLNLDFDSSAEGKKVKVNGYMNSLKLTAVDGDGTPFAADLAARITERTRLVWIEAPGSVSMEFPDLPALVALCRERGVISALDNTWGAGLAFKPFDLDGDGSHRLGVDVSVHALTKYPSGGGDVLMGSVMTVNQALHMRLKLTHMRLGFGVSGNDSETVLRSLPSIALRYRAHDQGARELARWLQQQPAVVQVLHPALPESPGHAHWAKLCGAANGGQGAAAGLFSVVIDPRHSQAQVDVLCDSLRLFKLGYSWGGPTSLVVPYEIETMRARPVPQLQPGTVVRFNIGLEAVEDLRADLAQALAKAFG